MEIYSIGFTQKSAAQFFGALKSAGIRRLMDVRLNNKSQLAGFTKSTDLPYFLRELCGAAEADFVIIVAGDPAPPDAPDATTARAERPAEADPEIARSRALEREHSGLLPEDAGAADLIAGRRLQLGISRGSPEQVIDGWRYFG